MLLRGIAFAEARRNSARRILKPQNTACEKDNADLTHDGVFQRNLASKANICLQSVNEHKSTTTRLEGEAISFVATASKLAAVEDAAPKGPEASIRSKATALKVSPTARATLQALRSPRNRISGPLTPPPTTTRDAETITEVCSGGELPEVEIISLLEEQIPRYRLRADTLTQFQVKNALLRRVCSVQRTETFIFDVFNFSSSTEASKL